MVQVVGEWLRGWRRCTPCLQRVMLQMEYVDHDIGQWSADTREQLREGGARFGVLVDIVCL
jgi:hypothetical protein